MGLLSKKLGGGGSALSGGSTVAYKWSNQGYTVAQILTKFKLPCVVQCATDSCSVLWSDFHFDLRQPLLLHNRRTVRKVHARSIQRKSSSDGHVEEFGPPLAIPEDYDGWFAASPKGENIVRRHFRVEGVATSGTRRFLVTTKLPAFSPGRGTDVGRSYRNHDVMPGEVLTRVYVMDEDPSDGPTFVRDEGPCLACLDEKDEAVLLPLKMRGILYEVADDYPGLPGTVFQISSVIKGGNSSLPRILTLVHGDPPVLAFTFTSMLRAYSVFTEETLLAGTLDTIESMCLEMITDSLTKFRLGLNESAIKQTCEYMNAQTICETFGPKFVTGIKVSFSLTPECSEQDDADTSMYQAESDAQEVDANSEFEFAWGSRKKKSKPNALSSTNSDVESGGDSAVKLSLPGRLLSPQSSTDDDDGSTVPGHRDFTEEEINELMRLKGLTSDLADAPGGQSSSSDIESLKGNMVRDNPLFYLNQSERGNSQGGALGGFPTASDTSDFSGYSTLTDSFRRPQGALVTRQSLQKESIDLQASSRNMRGPDGHSVEVLADVHSVSSQDVTYRSAREYDSDTAQDSTDEEDFEHLPLEHTPFKDVACKPAKEFDDTDDVDSDDSVDKGENTLPTLSPYPREAGPLSASRLMEMVPNLGEQTAEDDLPGEEFAAPACHKAARETARRLSYLIEEVTALVDSSTGRVAGSEDKSSGLQTDAPVQASNTSDGRSDSEDVLDTPNNQIVETVLDSDNESDRDRKTKCLSKAPGKSSGYENITIDNTVTGCVEESASSSDNPNDTTTSHGSITDVTNPDSSPDSSTNPISQEDVPSQPGSPLSNGSANDDLDDRVDASVSSISNYTLDVEAEPPAIPKKKLSPWTKKKKFQSAISFFTGLGDSKSKSKSEELSGPLKRSSKEKNIWSASSEHVSNPGWLSSVCSQERLQNVLKYDTVTTNRFGSTKVTLYPHHHPHRHPTDEHPRAKRRASSSSIDSKESRRAHDDTSALTNGVPSSRMDVGGTEVPMSPKVELDSPANVTSEEHVPHEKVEKTDLVSSLDYSVIKPDNPLEVTNDKNPHCGAESTEASFAQVDSVSEKLSVNSNTAIDIMDMNGVVDYEVASAVTNNNPSSQKGEMIHTFPPGKGGVVYKDPSSNTDVAIDIVDMAMDPDINDDVQEDATVYGVDDAGKDESESVAVNLGELIGIDDEDYV